MEVLEKNKILTDLSIINKSLDDGINYKYDEWNPATGFNYIPGAIMHAIQEIQTNEHKFTKVRNNGIGIYFADTKCISDRSLLAFWEVFL